MVLTPNFRIQTEGVLLYLIWVAQQLKDRTAGPGWFDLPAPDAADLPRLYREVEALRLRNQLDPKRFYKKDEGEGKGIKGLPKHFAVRRYYRSYLCRVVCLML